MRQLVSSNTTSQMFRFVRFSLVLILALSVSTQLPAAATSGLYHSVTFAQNDNAADPVFVTQTANVPTPLTLFANLSPPLTKSGFTFGSWNTSADGTGVSYVDGATFDFAAATVMYAIWTAPQTATASFVVNGGTGTIAPVTHPVGSATVLPAISGITNPGHTFVGWNTAANGSGTWYLSGSLYVFAGDQTLYAQWTANVYQVTYAANGGSVSPSGANYTFGTSALVLPTPTNTGFDFNGWFTAASGGTLIGLGGAAYSPNAASVLYAQWTQVATDTLTFNANGGSGSVAPISGLHGSSITLPGQLGLLHAGFVLSRWSSTSKGSGTSYIVGQTIKLSGSSILYAQWNGHASAVLLGAVGNFAKNSQSLTAALKREVKQLALSVKGKKYHSVLLYGYTATTGLQSLNLSLSRARATGVANYLRSELRVLHVNGVSIASAGEGAISGGSSAAYSRVEVFVR
jgi:uncharacterized repeat protein (TIGR02543 family)